MIWGKKYVVLKSHKSSKLTIASLQGFCLVFLGLKNSHISPFRMILHLSCLPKPTRKEKPGWQVPPPHYSSSSKKNPQGRLQTLNPSHHLFCSHWVTSTGPKQSEQYFLSQTSLAECGLLSHKEQKSFHRVWQRCLWFATEGRRAKHLLPSRTNEVFWGVPQIDLMDPNTSLSLSLSFRLPRHLFICFKDRISCSPCWS